MTKSSVRPTGDVEKVLRVHGNLLFRTSLITVLVLYYVEGYRTEEIAKIIGKSTSAVKMRLQKGRRLLEDIYRREYL